MQRLSLDDHPSQRLLEDGGINRSVDFDVFADVVRSTCWVNLLRKPDPELNRGKWQDVPPSSAWPHGLQRNGRTALEVRQQNNWTCSQESVG